MRSIFYFLLVLGVTCCAGCGEDQLRVCTWNVRKLGWSASGGQDPGLVARAIHENCDVAALQEVMSTSARDLLAARLGQLDGSWVIKLTDQTYGTEYYGVALRASAASAEHLAWKCNPSSSGSRPICAARVVSGGLWLWLAAIHVYWSQTEDERQKNVARLGSELGALLGADQSGNVALVGDFNVDPADAPDAWRALQAGPPRLVKIASDTRTNISNGAFSKSYDHILLNVPLFDYYTGVAGIVDPLRYAADLKQFAQWASDHTPVQAVLRLP